MKFVLFSALGLVMLLSSCNTPDEGVQPRTFSFSNSANMVTELTWTVKEGNTVHSNGNNYVDVDIFIDPTDNDGDYYSSTSGSSFETINVPTDATDGTYQVAVKYYGNNGEPNLNYIVTYTIKMYPYGNVAAAQTFTGVLGASLV